jgi:hypothetical protein
MARYQIYQKSSEGVLVPVGNKDFSDAKEALKFARTSGQLQVDTEYVVVRQVFNFFLKIKTQVSLKVTPPQPKIRRKKKGEPPAGEVTA